MKIKQINKQKKKKLKLNGVIKKYDKYIKCFIYPSHAIKFILELKNKKAIVRNKEKLNKNNINLFINSNYAYENYLKKSNFVLKENISSKDLINFSDYYSNFYLTNLEM